MKNSLCILLLAVTLALQLHAGDTAPKEQAEIDAALARGAALRQATAVQPEVLFTQALLLKSGDVRCGHAIIKLEDAKGENGAAYRLKEELHAVFIGPDSAKITGGYTAEFELGADFGLRSGKATTPLKQEKAGGAVQSMTYQATLKISEPDLLWELKVLDDAGKVMQQTSDKIKLYKTRPMPKTLLNLLGLLRSKIGDADIAVPLAVPAFETAMLHDGFPLEAAWLNFSREADGAFGMRVRGLVCEPTPEKFEADPPSKEIWNDLREFTLDKNFRWAKIPSLPQPGSSFELIDAASLDVNAPLDIDKIRAATKAANKK